MRSQVKAWKIHLKKKYLLVYDLRKMKTKSVGDSNKKLLTWLIIALYYIIYII